MGFAGFDYASAAEVWDEFRQLTARPAVRHDGHDRRAAAPRAAPALALPERGPSAAASGATSTGVFPTPDGRAGFLPRDAPARRARLTDHEFPFVLTTGRLYAHWHTLTRTAKCDKLVRREPGPFVEIHPDDAGRLDVAEGELVQVSSRRGTIQLPARLQRRRRAGDGVRAVPLGRPVRAGQRGQLPDDQRHRPRRQAAGAEVLRGQPSRRCRRP